MLIALALQVAVLEDAFAHRSWAHFSRSPALAHSVETVDIATTSADPLTHRLGFTMRLTRHRLSRPDETRWADSRTCPAVRSVLAAMHDLAMPKPSVPGLEDNLEIILDGTGYDLRVGATFANANGHKGTGALEVSSNIGTPLARWVDQSLAALDRCWSPREPDMRRQTAFLTRRHRSPTPQSSSFTVVSEGSHSWRASPSKIASTRFPTVSISCCSRPNARARFPAVPT